jgi:hypothetical protein
MDLLSEEDVFEETEVLGESVVATQKAAQAWLDDLEIGAS